MSTLVLAFEGLPLWAGAVVVVGGFTALSVLLARFTQRRFQSKVLEDHNELTGFIFAVVGVIYAVVLGFVALSVWERFASAEEATYAEAGNLTTVYRDAALFPAAGRLQQEIRVYVHDIETREWPSMQRGRQSEIVESQAEDLAHAVNVLVPATRAQGDVHVQMIDAMADALTARGRRLAIDNTGLNGVMWTVVILGGFITVAYSFLFGFRRTSMQTAMVGTLALIIGLVIFLTMSLDYPFQGSVRVRPDAFERANVTFDAIDRANGSPHS